MSLISNLSPEIILLSDTFDIHYIFNNSIKLDNTKYNYFIQLLSVSFNNVDSNVLKPFNVVYKVGNDAITKTQFLEKGIYTMAQIIEAFNDKFTGIMELSANLSTGKISVKNKTNGELKINVVNGDDKDDFFNSSILNFKVDENKTLDANETLEAEKMANIKDYNSYFLCSDNIGAYTYIGSGRTGSLYSANVLYRFNSQSMAPLQNKDWVAMRELLYNINTDTLQDLNFYMTNEFGERLTSDRLLGTTDFVITIKLVARPKVVWGQT